MKSFLTLFVIATLLNAAGDLTLICHETVETMGGKIQQLVSDSEDNTWAIGKENSVWKLEDGTWSQQFLEASLSSVGYIALRLTPHKTGGIWLTGDDSATYFYDQAGTFHKYPVTLIGSSISTDQQGNTWGLTTHPNKPCRFINGKWEILPGFHEYSYTIHGSDNGHVILGSGYAAFYRFNDTAWEALPVPPHLNDQSCAVEVLSDGTFWCVGDSSGGDFSNVFYFDGSSWIKKSIPDVLFENDITDIIPINADEIWLRTKANWTYRCNFATGEYYQFNYEYGLPGDKYNSGRPGEIVFDSTGKAWTNLIGSLQDKFKNLAYYEDGLWHLIPDSLLSFDQVQGIRRGQDGSIWFWYDVVYGSGFKEYFGITHLKDGAFTHYRESSFSQFDDNINSIDVLSNGDVWCLNGYSSSTFAETYQLTLNPPNPVLSTSQKSSVAQRVRACNNKIYVQGLVANNVFITLYGLNGKVVFQTTTENRSGSVQFAIPSTLAAGVYSVSVLNGPAQFSQRLMIQ